MGQFHDHNHEELDSLFTRPTLDYYLCNKYWNFLTADLSKEEVQDLEHAREQLEKYERTYSLMEYGADLNGLLTTLETRIGSNNPSLPQTIYKKVPLFFLLSCYISFVIPKPKRIINENNCI